MAHAARSPGDSTLERESRRMTRPAESRERKEGTGCCGGKGLRLIFKSAKVLVLGDHALAVSRKEKRGSGVVEARGSVGD